MRQSLSSLECLYININKNYNYLGSPTRPEEYIRTGGEPGTPVNPALKHTRHSAKFCAVRKWYRTEDNKVGRGSVVMKGGFGPG